MTDFLAAQAAVTAVVGTRIGTSLSTAAGAAIRVARVGGTQAHSWEDNPELQIECWSADLDRASANDLASIVVSVIPDIRGTHPTPGGYVSSYDIGPVLPLPDLDTNRARVVVSVTLATHPL